MKWFVAILLLLGAGAALAGFGYIGYSFRGPGYDPDKGVTVELEAPVVVAVTTGKIGRGNGSSFFRELHHVLNQIPHSSGLIGYAVRKQLIGNQVWTLSAWTNEDSLDRFLHSEPHRRAVEDGGISRASVKSVVVAVPPEELPISWKRVQEILRGARANSRNPQNSFPSS